MAASGAYLCVIALRQIDADNGVASQLQATTAPAIAEAQTIVEQVQQGADTALLSSRDTLRSP